MKYYVAATKAQMLKAPENTRNESDPIFLEGHEQIISGIIEHVKENIIASHRKLSRGSGYVAIAERFRGWKRHEDKRSPSCGEDIKKLQCLAEDIVAIQAHKTLYNRPMKETRKCYGCGII